MSEMFYKVCIRHLRRKEYAVLFWGQNNQGYTMSLDTAGKYTREQCKDYFDNKDDFAVPCHELDFMSINMEYRIENERWIPRRIVLNNQLFWDRYDVDPKKLHYYKGDIGDLRYWRYPVSPPATAHPSEPSSSGKSAETGTT